MKRILFVGEHPFLHSGNAGMMSSILNSVDTSKYEINLFAVETSPLDPASLISNPLPYSIVGSVDNEDRLGNVKLLRAISYSNIDAIVMVGLDIWAFSNILKDIKKIVSGRGIPWASIFPYDLQNLRKDWTGWINYYTHPYVYSKWGEEILKEVVPHIKYFRPPLRSPEVWRKFDNSERATIRQRMFPIVSPDTIIFGFVGANQIRKDPQKIIKAFSIVKQKTNKDVRLYLHTEVKGMFNLQQYALDCGLKTRDVFSCNPNDFFSLEKMVEMYNSIDCLVNCSYQEGLSWTLVEAMLCGTPFIATRTTAQIELLENAGYPVSCEELAYLPMIGGKGSTWVEVKSAKLEDLVGAMADVANFEALRENLSLAGLKEGKKWLEGVSDINELLDDMMKEPPKVEKIDAVLFAQHSSAGDVLMTTQCLKGIKERYGLPLHYMTSIQYMDILANNPYIDEILPWNEDKFGSYRVVLNPHSDRILPGHWGRNSNSLLSDFYWKILDVEPNDFFIEFQKPTLNESGMPLVEFIEGSFKPIAILHTTGGDPEFRTYKYMHDVHEGIKDRYTTIQLGGLNDFSAGADIDLRGKLSFREAAWVMSKASIAVTVDSFISHLAGFLGVSQVCLFGTGNSNVVMPKQIEGKLICLKIDYIRECPGLGPCSASVRDCPVPCTGRHNPKTILKAINDIEVNNETSGSSIQSI